MANLTFVDTHNMVAYLSKSDASAYLSKSDASACFDQVMDFLNGHVIYAKRTAWNEFSYSMGYSVIYLAIGRKFNFSKYVFDSMVRNVDSPSKFLITRQNCSSTGDSQAQKEGQEVREEEEIKVFWFKEVKKGGKIEAIDVDEDITLVDAETQVDMDVELQRRIDDVSDVAKEVNVVEPIVFDDEEVIMNMAQTFIKMKAKKARRLNEQMAKRLHDEEVEQATAREELEKDDLEKAKGLQQQYDEKQENIDWNVIAEQIQEKHLDNIRKYQSLKRKPIFIAQARKNMIIYLKNMAGCKMEHFRDMTYDKKRVAEETLLQESFKKLKAVKVLEKDYPMLNAVMIMMLSAKLQVEEDSEMARDLVMKIFMEANKPKSKS
nr:hypothetical protein [Tanacetum cinerariifolium]